MYYLLLFLGILLPYSVGAGAPDGATTYSFVNSLSLWIAVIIGTVASLLVFRHAARVGGKSLLGKVYNFFASGMLVTVLALFVVTIPPWADGFVIARTHDILFVLGFGLMAMGAEKMLLEVGMK